ncbi:MAG TPA: aminotransferase class I/II-fold pyridoxal phosphate-dependent enzyme, partial [Acidimicrobiales bacterium]|nr:aminotransferase class I/II-fold pyridoxal phosphate-dependent enzyme [Acidimicrobiales bacterium]
MTSNADGSPPFASRVAGLGGIEAAAWEIHAAAVRRREAGEDVILLSVGDPDYPTPPSIVAAAKASLDRGRTHYAEVVGQLALREAIARHHHALGAPEVDPAQVVVLAGAQSALFAACQCL